ncbi:phosphate ABC transporter substrate-binding protein PstS [Amnibacterium kyonggiense]
MKHLRAGLAIGTALTAIVALSSCASNESTPASSASGSAGSSSSAAPISGTLNGVGSSAQSNAQTAWAKGFQTANSGATVNYNPSGSGAGRTAFENGGADFAGSDAALPSAELSGSFKECKSGTKGIDIPVYVSSVALVYNLQGVKNLQLDATTIAKIFSGKITKWNDSAIKALNSGVSLPSENITPVYRSDKSGTTNNFTDYLHQTAPSIWTAAAADAFPFKTGEGAAKGSGVVAAVSGGKGTIGYVDFSSVGTLSYAKVKVGSSYVAPTTDAASKTAETSPLDTTRESNDVVVKVNRTTTDTSEYPITLVSYLIACQTYSDSTKGALVKAYAQYVTSDAGQQAAASTAKSAPMTGTLSSKAQAAAASIG